MTEENALTTIQQETELTEYAVERGKLQMVIKKAMKENIDYGVIPGTKKKTLWEPGAEKIAKIFSLMPKFTLIKELEDFDKGFFYFKYKCTLIHFHTEKFAGEAERSCNSMEKKYATISKSEKWATDEDRERMIGKKKNEKYGGYDLILKKTPLEQADQVNTIQAMAQKRAFVAAVKVATGASEIFGEDEIEVDGDTRVPSKPKQGGATAVVDRAKSDAMKRVHAMAAERGFTHEQVSNSAKKQFGVTSLSECTLEQLTDITDRLEMTFEVVGAGNPPKKIGADINVNVDTSPKVSKDDVIDGEVTTAGEIACRLDGCEKVAPDDGPHAFFCSDEHSDEYWAGKKPAKKKAPDDWTFSANRESK